MYLKYVQQLSEDLRQLWTLRSDLQCCSVGWQKMLLACFERNREERVVASNYCIHCRVYYFGKRTKNQIPKQRLLVVVKVGWRNHKAMGSEEGLADKTGPFSGLAAQDSRHGAEHLIPRL